MTERKEDALYVKDSTTVEEILRYVRDCTVNPTRYEGHTIWNYSSYEFDEEVFKGKQQKELLIPYEVTGTWAFMYMLLPEKIRQAEVLVYRPEDDEYVALRTSIEPCLLHREKSSGRRLKQRSAKRSGTNEQSATIL